MNLTKVSVVLVTGFIVATVIGCEPRSSSTVSETTVLKMATDSGAKGSPAGNALLRWAELIETGTNGELDVKVFYQNELGGPQDVFDLYIANDINLRVRIVIDFH